MDEILALQQELAEVQKASTAHKLSERNCVDIISKLKAAGLLQVVYTLNAKEYLTPKQLEREIQDEILAHGGRVTANEIQVVINVDLAHIENSLETLVRSDSSLTYLAGEVISSWYLDGVAEELNELLQEKGQITLGTLASQYNFSVEFTRDFVSSRLGSLIHAQLKQGVLYTDAFVLKEEARIRGVFSAVTRPTSLPALTSTYGFEDKTTEDTVKRMIENGTLPGFLKGRDYIPHIFAVSQREALVSFFKANGYLEHSRAKKLEVTKPYEFLKPYFPSCVPLDSCVISSGLFNQVEAAVEHALQEGAWLDIRSLLPPSVSDANVSTLTRKLKAMKGGKHLHLADVYVVSDKFVESCLSKFRDVAVSEAEQFASQQRNASTSHSTVELDEEIDSKASRRSGRREVEESDTEDNGDKGGRKGKSSKGGKKRVGKKGRGQEEDDVAVAEEEDPGSRKGKKNRGKKSTTSASSNGSTETSPLSRFPMPSEEDLAEKLVQWFEDLEEHPTLSRDLAQDLSAKVSALYADAVRNAFTSVVRGDAAVRKRLKVKFDELFEAAQNELRLQMRGIEHLASLCRDDTDFLDSKPPSAGSADDKRREGDRDSIEDTKEGEVALSADDRKVLEDELGSSAAPVVKLWASALGTKRSLQSFLELLDAACQSFGAPVYKADKKRDRQLLFALKHRRAAQLSQAADWVEVARVSAALLFQQTTGAALAVPRDAVCMRRLLVVMKEKASTMAIGALIELLDAIATEEQSADHGPLLNRVKETISGKEVKD